MSRKVARKLAFKVVFSLGFQWEEDTVDLLIEELKQETGDITDEDLSYIKEVTHGVVEQRTELDDKISKYLKGWTMDRISRIDHAILRLATYEILYREDIPYKVSVNEAVELAKSFSDDTSASFINGVLAGIISDLGDGGVNGET